jgi:hypothetical protein
MRAGMRHLLLSLVLLLPLAAACEDDDGHLHPAHDAGADSGSAGRDAGPVRPSALSRPALPRPPRTGLPPELRPPR